MSAHIWKSALPDAWSNYSQFGCFKVLYFWSSSSFCKTLLGLVFKSMVRNSIGIPESLRNTNFLSAQLLQEKHFCLPLKSGIISTALFISETKHPWKAQQRSFKPVCSGGFGNWNREGRDATATLSCSLRDLLPHSLRNSKVKTLFVYSFHIQAMLQIKWALKD